MPTFTPPTVEEGPAGPGPLFNRYRISRGITVLKEAGVYRQVRYPSQAECSAADVVYLGGHEYPITQAEAVALTAAGYGAYVTPHTNTYDAAIYDSAVYG